MTTTVSRSESNTERFGRVIQYRVDLDGVTFTAERMVGLDDAYTVSAHVGHCGHSFRNNVGTVPVGPNVSGRFLTLAETLRTYPEAFIDANHADGGHRSASMCTDREACDRFRVYPPTDPARPTDAEREQARVAGVYSFNVGIPNVWHMSDRMRAMLTPGENHTERGRILVGIFSDEWERNAAYSRKRDAERVPA